MRAMGRPRSVTMTSSPALTASRYSLSVAAKRGWLLVLADGAGRVALRVHRAEEPERFVWIGVEKLVRFFRRYVDQGERVHVKSLAADAHAAAPAQHEDGVGVVVPLQAADSTRLDLEVAQLEGGGLAGRAHQDASGDALPGQGALHRGLVRLHRYPLPGEHGRIEQEQAARRADLLLGNLARRHKELGRRLCHGCTTTLSARPCATSRYPSAAPFRSNRCEIRDSTGSPSASRRRASRVSFGPAEYVGTISTSRKNMSCTGRAQRSSGGTGVKMTIRPPGATDS